MKTKILICEDDKEISELLCYFLTDRGYECLSADNGMRASMLVKDTPDIGLILLDLMLPFKSGDSVLREIRETSDVPVIVVSAKDTVQTKVELMRLGADDYVTKPFDLDELLVRIEAVLRRATSRSEQQTKIRFKNIVFDSERRTCEINGKELQLTAKEFLILQLLLKNPNKLFSKANLYESVWNEHYIEDENNLKVHISTLRSKLAKADPDNEYIETVWGMGYRLKN